MNSDQWLCVLTISVKGDFSKYDNFVFLIFQKQHSLWLYKQFWYQYKSTRSVFKSQFHESVKSFFENLGYGALMSSRIVELASSFSETALFYNCCTCNWLCNCQSASSQIRKLNATESATPSSFWEEKNWVLASVSKNFGFRDWKPHFILLCFAWAHCLEPKCTMKALIPHMNKI